MSHEHLANLFEGTEIYSLNSETKVANESNSEQLNAGKPDTSKKEIPEQPEKPLFKDDKIYIFADYQVQEDEKAFLIKILGAVKISLEQDCEVGKWNASAKEFNGRNFVFSQHITSCGLTSNRISAPALKSIAANVELKKELWENMQKLFL